MRKREFFGLSVTPDNTTNNPCTGGIIPIMSEINAKYGSPHKVHAEICALLISKFNITPKSVIEGRTTAWFLGDENRMRVLVSEYKTDTLTDLLTRIRDWSDTDMFKLLDEIHPDRTLEFGESCQIRGFLHAFSLLGVEMCTVNDRLTMCTAGGHTWILHLTDTDVNFKVYMSTYDVCSADKQGMSWGTTHLKFIDELPWNTIRHGKSSLGEEFIPNPLKVYTDNDVQVSSNCIASNTPRIYVDELDTPEFIPVYIQRIIYDKFKIKCLACVTSEERTIVIPDQYMTWVIPIPLCILIRDLELYLVDISSIRDLADYLWPDIFKDHELKDDQQRLTNILGEHLGISRHSMCDNITTYLSDNHLICGVTYQGETYFKRVPVDSDIRKIAIGDLVRAFDNAPKNKWFYDIKEVK